MMHYVANAHGPLFEQIWVGVWVDCALNALEFTCERPEQPSIDVARRRCCIANVVIIITINMRPDCGVERR